MLPKIKLCSVSNVFVRMMYFKNVGDTELGHSHFFDHVTLLTNGSMNITVNSKTTEYVAPIIIFIKKGLEHTLVATSDNTIAFCIHGLRDGPEITDIIDPLSIPEGVDIAALAMPVSKNIQAIDNINSPPIKRAFILE